MKTANETTSINSHGTRRSRRIRDLPAKPRSSLDDWDKGADKGDLCAAKRLPTPRGASGLSPAASSPLAKRLRTGYTPPLAPVISPPFQIPIDDLCGGIIQRIYGMLNDPRDIWNFSRCNRRLGELVEYKSIVRAAAYNAVLRDKEKPIRILKTIGRAMMAESAFVPSPQRLLRVVNGIRCEMGSSCWNYNFEENTTPRIGNCHSSCIFICNECENNLHSCVRPYSQVDALRDLLNRIKLESENEVYPHISSRPLSIPITENNAESESIGYYITMRDLKQMTISCSISSSMPLSVQEKVRSAKAAGFVARLVTRVNKDPKRRFRCKLIQFIQEALKDCEALRLEIDQKRHDARVEMFRMKLAKYRIIHDKLSDLLGDADWKESALDCKWDSFDNFWTFDKPLARYSCNFVQCYMEKYIVAPSTIRKKHLKQIADIIKMSFHIMNSSGFFDYDYLSHEDVYENALLRYAFEHFTPDTLYKLVETQHIECMLQGNLTTALSLVSQVDPKHSYGVAMKTLDLSSDNQYFSADDFRKFAMGKLKQCNIYNDKTSHCLSEMKLFTMAFAVMFDELKISILAYLNDDMTKAFLSETSENEPDHGLTRAEIVRRCLVRIHTQEGYYSWDVSTPYTQILDLHRRAFQWPTFMGRELLFDTDA